MARLIQDEVNTSREIARLSPKAMSLYFLIIPKLNAYGKLNGDPYTIKGLVCRHVEWLDLDSIEICLKEISENTDMKFWSDDNGDHWIQDLNFDTKQSGLRKDRRGKDNLPDYPGPDFNEKIIRNQCVDTKKQEEVQDNSGSTPGQLREYSAPEGEGEGEGELEKDKCVYIPTEENNTTGEPDSDSVPSHTKNSVLDYFQKKHIEKFRRQTNLYDLQRILPKAQALMRTHGREMLFKLVDWFFDEDRSKGDKWLQSADYSFNVFASQAERLAQGPPGARASPEEIAKQVDEILAQRNARRNRAIQQN